MGKQSRLKRERKARRKEQKPQIEAWSQIPDDAERGPCRKPGCALAHCLDPWVTQVELTNKVYEGPLVMVCYSRFPTEDSIQHQSFLCINGEEISAIATADLARRDPATYNQAVKTLLDTVSARYGAGAGLAVVQHLSQSPQHLEKQRKNVEGNPSA